MKLESERSTTGFRGLNSVQDDAKSFNLFWIVLRSIQLNYSEANTKVLPGKTWKCRSANWKSRLKACNVAIRYKLFLLPHRIESLTGLAVSGSPATPPPSLWFATLTSELQSGFRFSLIPRSSAAVNKKYQSKLVFFVDCAGWENRTPNHSLENCYLTIKLIPQFPFNLLHTGRSAGIRTRSHLLPKQGC